MYYIFDDPSYGYLLAAAVEIGAMIYITVSQRRYRKMALLAGVIVGLTVWGLDKAVETDREQAETLTKNIVKASVAPDSAYIVGMLHETMSIGGINREQMATILRSFLRKKQFSSNTIKSLDVLKADKEDAKVEFTVVTVFDQSGDYAMGGMATSKWQFDFNKSKNGRYKITDIEMISMNNEKPPVDWRKEIRR